MRTKTLKSHTLIASAETHLGPKRRLKVVGNFGKSSVVRHVNAGERAQAGDAFLMWNKAAGKVMKGLTRRREAERHLFLTGDYGVAAPHEVAHA